MISGDPAVDGVRSSLFFAKEPVQHKALLCNTTKLSGRTQYVAIVRFSPSEVDAARGLQAMLCTFVADAHDKGPDLIEWLATAMDPKSSEPLHESSPLSWTLLDVNCSLLRSPHSLELMGVTKPLLDELFFHVAPGALVGVVMALFLAIRLLAPVDAQAQKESDRAQLNELLSYDPATVSQAHPRGVFRHP